MAEHPYREPAQSEAKVSPGPTSLAYTPKERVDRATSMSSALQTFGAPAIALGVGLQVSEAAGVIAAIVTFAILTIYRRQKAKRLETRLEIDAGKLHVFVRGKVHTLHLTDLRNVELETKAVERIMDRSASTFGLVTLGQDALIAPTSDSNRIVLQTESKRLPLSEAYHGHADTLEWFGTVRGFLRKHGWVPEDERDLAGDEA